MTVIGMISGGLLGAFAMFWHTLWALVLGFGLSGAVQAFVSRPKMQQVLGDHRPGTLRTASFFGVISSSCSYAAAALTKSLFSRGADFTAALIFMVASTNLVIELGVVLWLLIGWQFALAEFVGGAIMVLLLGLLAPRVFPRSWVQGAQERLAVQEAAVRRPEDGMAEHESTARRIGSRRGWSDAAAYTVSDLTMLRRELVIGFLVAGLLAMLVPADAWQWVFLTGHGFLSSVENVLVAPLVAIISFVCSIGNVVLAAALWHGGVSFGGVVAFIFADLITLPLLSIYRKYYGTRMMLRILVVFWLTMSASGLAVEYLFRLIRIPQPARPLSIMDDRIRWDYNTVLDIVALVAFALIYWLYRTRDTDAGRYAKDPVCGMQVEVAQAPATRPGRFGTVYFCSDHCAARYDTDPEHFQVDGAAADPARHSSVSVRYLLGFWLTMNVVGLVVGYIFHLVDTPAGQRSPISDYAVVLGTAAGLVYWLYRTRFVVPVRRLVGVAETATHAPRADRRVGGTHALLLLGASVVVFGAIVAALFFFVGQASSGGTGAEGAGAGWAHALTLVATALVVVALTFHVFHTPGAGPARGDASTNEIADEFTVGAGAEAAVGREPTERIMDSMHHEHTHGPASTDESVAPILTGTATDPVCNMQVERAGAQFTAQFEGQTIYFCCAACQKSFTADPGRYAGALAAAPRS